VLKDINQISPPVFSSVNRALHDFLVFQICKERFVEENTDGEF